MSRRPSDPRAGSPGAPGQHGVDDVALARRLAAAAGDLLLDLRARSALSARELGDAGDERANALILRGLAEERPDDAVLSEESPDHGGRAGERRVWIVDPLDGTREYRAGRDEWAVHVGLALDGEAAVGAVALPAAGRVLDSASVPPVPASGDTLRIVVSRSRAPELCSGVAERLGATLIPMGSAGAKIMAVVDGRADAYLHSGGQYEWDNCAPVAIARAAGLHASRVDGSPLRYNRPDPMLPDLLVCRMGLAVTLLRAIAECG